MEQQGFRKLRCLKRQTHKEVAEQIGVAESTYRKYECSARLPSAQVVTKMVQAYGCTASEVLDAYNYHQHINQVKTKRKTKKKGKEN